jgi:hypothetical protein
MHKTHLLMSMQAVSSRDEHAMETEESIISTVIVTTSPLYELFKLYYFHLLVLLVRSELRCNSPSLNSILSPHIGPYLLQYCSDFQKQDRFEVAEVKCNFLSPQIIGGSFTSNKIHVLDSANS